MICEECHGIRYTIQTVPIVAIVPCPTCSGTGLAYCCEATGLNCDVTNAPHEIDNEGLHSVE